jgi:hypothetical protein
MMARLMSFPADQFVLLQKGGRPLLCLRRPRGMHLRFCRQRGCDGQIPSQLWDIAGGRPVVREFYGPRAEYDQQHGERRRWGTVQ